jgi:hypothetical protein
MQVSLTLLIGGGPDADRHAKPLVQLAMEGSLLGTYSHRWLRKRRMLVLLVQYIDHHWPVSSTSTGDSKKPTTGELCAMRYQTACRLTS